MTLVEPSDHEDKYFHKLDAEKTKKLRAEMDEKREEEAKQHRQKAHWMKCPKCGEDLKEINYQNVMIDICHECEGIWLDHGELELLVQGEAKVTKSFFKKLFE